MTDVQSLKASIAQYELQLAQVKTTLSTTIKGPDQDNLLSLKSDIEELIGLTKESLQSLENNETENKNDSEYFSEDDEDPMEKEYALFKTELEENSEDSKNVKQSDTTAGTLDDIEDELKALEGMKCRVPHGNSWGGTGYHNAMVCFVHKSNDMKITSMQDIKVRILFINPVHREMLPCPYFLDGNCKFSDEQCNYSHGEIVPLASLQEYKEPDFRSIKVGSRVLVKQKNKLWHTSIVLKLPDLDGNEYTVKFETSGNITLVGLQDLLPFNDGNVDLSDRSEDSDSEPCHTVAYSNEQLIHESLLKSPLNQPLGEWEKHTRGMGSKLMARMGYITGTGLGKLSDGRIEPVEATVMPAGKSLDHCMELRENAGQDESLFTVERRLRKQRRKMEQQREKQYQREKQREEKNIFNFINATLGDKPKDESAASSSQIRSSFKTDSNWKLNVASLQIGQNITKLEKESLKLKYSLARHTKGSALYNHIIMQYNGKQEELSKLRDSEKSITAEQNQRKTKAKLSVF